MSPDNSGKQGTGPNALRRGRFSQPGANYFVTICVEPRIPVLIPGVAAHVLEETRRIQEEGHWHLRCATVMPDHLHLLFVLGDRLSLSRTIARLKAMTREELRDSGADWQSNFYDHKLRDSDSVEQVIRYNHLNPFRKGLVGKDGNWPYFRCSADDWEWYRTVADDGRPFPEWLR